MNLTTARVIGFFSLPSPTGELAEAQPEAFRLAWQQAGPGAGSCAACGMSILHHVIVQIADGSKHFIGTDCAERVGDETVRRCVRAKKTAEQIAAEDAEREQRIAEFRVAEAARVARVEARAESLKDILAALEGTGNSFHASLASQLRAGALTERQAEFVAKAMFGRCTKKNSAAFEAICDRCTAEAFPS